MTIKTQLSNYPSFQDRFPTFAIDITEESLAISLASDTETTFAVPEQAKFFRVVSADGSALVAGNETTPALGDYNILQQGEYEINPGMRRIKSGVTTIYVRNIGSATTIINITFYKGSDAINR